jgi:DNA-binding response OmpR family regulator
MTSPRNSPGLAPLALTSLGHAAPIVLIIEREAVLRQVLVRLLGGRYTLFAPPDGQAALDLLALIPVPDAVILDVTLPRTGGSAPGLAVEADPRLARVPVLCLTAGTLEVVAPDSARSVHHLTKPFRVADLLARLEAMVSSR